MTLPARAATLPEMDTSTRYIGWCPVCQRDIKVRNGLLVHHGYERPGVGYIIGDCPGVGHEPYETGTGACEYYLKAGVLYNIERVRPNLQILTRPQGPPSLVFENYDVETRRYIRDPRTREIETVRLTRAQVDELQTRLPSYDRDHYNWERKLRITIINTENELLYWESEMERIEGLIRTWTPQPLRTVEEEIARATETRAERTRQRQAEREQRMAEALVSLQQRIDSAVRNRRPETIRNLFEDGYNKLVQLSGYTLERDDVLRLVDRDNVWRAFGLVRDDGAYESDWRTIIDLFKRWNPYGGGAPAPFPAELGGGKVKLRR